MNDLPKLLREQANWLESRGFAVLTGKIEREAADEIDRVQQLVDDIANALIVAIDELDDIYHYIREIKGEETKQDTCEPKTATTEKLQRVRDWLKSAANSEGGIVAEIDEALDSDRRINDGQNATAGN